MKRIQLLLSLLVIVSCHPMLGMKVSSKKAKKILHKDRVITDVYNLLKEWEQVRIDSDRRLREYQEIALNAQAIEDDEAIEFMGFMSRLRDILHNKDVDFPLRTLNNIANAKQFAAELVEKYYKHKKK